MTIDGNDELCALATHSIWQSLQRETESLLHASEAKSFRSITCSIDCLGITPLPFCSKFASLFQETALKANISDRFQQEARLKKLKRFGTKTCNIRAVKNPTHASSIIVFSYAERSAESGQLCHTAGSLVGPLQAKSIFHILSRKSCKALLSVKFIGTTETLAAGEAIDMGKSFIKTYKQLMEISRSCNWSRLRDLFGTLFTQRQFIYSW